MSHELAEFLRQKVDEFDHNLKLRDYSVETRRNYRTPLLALADWVEADEQLRNLVDLSAQVLEKFWAELSFRPPRRKRKRGAKTLSSGTLRLYATGLRSFFQYLVLQGELLGDPSHGVIAPRRQRTVRGAILSPREVLRLLMAIELDTPEGLRDRAVVELVYSTGIRRGELAGLNLQELDLETGWLRVLGKGKKMRYVPVGHEAELALRGYLRDARPRLARAENEALFLRTNGERYSGHCLGKLLHRLAAEAGIKKRVTPHVLRHACATHMLAGKADIRYIQALLGHSSIESTQIYTKVELSELQQVVRACHPRERDL